MKFKSLANKTIFPDIELYTNNKNSEISQGVYYADANMEIISGAIYVGLPDEIEKMLLHSKDAEEMSSSCFIAAGKSSSLLQTAVQQSLNLAVTESNLYEIYNKCASLYMKHLIFEKKMNDMLMLNAPIDSILAYLTETTKSVAYICNTGFRIIASDRHILETEDDKHIIKQVLSFDTKAFIEEGEFKRLTKSENVFAEKLLYNGNNIGYIIFIFTNSQAKELNDAYCTTAVPVMEQACNFHFPTFGDNIKFNQFIIDLIESKLTSFQDIAVRKELIAWTESSRYACIIIRQVNKAEHSEEFLLYHFKSLFPWCNTAYYKGMLLLTVPTKTRHIELIYDVRFTDFLNKYNLIAGVSYAFSDLRMYRSNYTAATFALDFGPRFSEKKGLHKRIFRYEDYVEFHRIKLIMTEDNLYYHHNNINYLAIPQYLILQRYDKENNDNLVETFICYLYCNSNAVLAANKLFIHRNTLYRKLEKIAELCNKDIDDADFKCRMLFSHKVNEYCEITRGIELINNLL